MPLVTVTCPSCDFSRAYQSSSIPAGTSTATCPKCGRTFALQAPRAEEPEQRHPGATATPPPPMPPGQEPPPLAPRPTPPPAAAPPLQRRRIAFSFSGTARDYFGIWIVNTMLKIVTFGIYSAWAKVRKRRYFYGNTALDRLPFEYLADPFVLFKGWLIAAGCFVLYSVGSRLNPLMASCFSLIFFLAMPWLVVRSRIFNLRYSAHRNIRFTFAPNYREAYLVYAGLPFLLPFTLGLIAPYVVYRQKKFLVENSGYGRTRCTFQATARDYYLVFLKALGWLVAVLVAFAFLAVFLSQAFSDLSPIFLKLGAHGSARGRLVLWTAASFAAWAFLYLFFTIYLRTELVNLTWSSTRIRNSRFSSTLRIAPMAWLSVSNALAVILSCGLMIPWATVRLTRYRMENLALELNDEQDSFLGWGHRQIDSTGEEIGDMFGIEVGL